MKIDPSIYFIVVIPDWRPEDATPTQGFAPSLLFNARAIRAASILPGNIYDLTAEGQETLLARRMSGRFPIHWYGQSPRAIRSFPNPASIPFSLILLPEGESPADYKEWADASPLRPTLVAEKDGDLRFENLTVDDLQKHFLEVCDRLPKEVDAESIEEAREALKSWKPVTTRKLGYQVGGHNSVTPNLIALHNAGFRDLVSGPFHPNAEGIKPYADQIVLTTNSVLDEREQVGERDLQRIFRRPPDINLFCPAIYPQFFEVAAPPTMPKDEKKRFEVTRQVLQRQTGYNYEFRTDAQQAGVLGKVAVGTDGKAKADTHPLMLLRSRELSLCTELMSVVAASEFSAVVRFPNELNRTLGTVRNFAEHYRSDQPTTRKRLLGFRQVQARLDGAVPAEFLDLIRRSKSGIRIVADAHLEWLNVDGLPLCIRKDCSRVPVTPGNMLVELLSAREPLLLAPEDFKTILVISALNRDDPIQGLFELAFETFEPEWRDKVAVEFAEVRSADDLVKALNEFDGPMVVFDGHGGHEKGEPAKLLLGDEAVDIWSLRDKVTRMPPIVILSACDTHAADRNHATTANGFLSLGATAVLSSVFPLEATSAASFAARLVYRVSQFLPAAIGLYDRALTWTEVISGMLRMQLMTDFLRQLKEKKEIDQALYEEAHLAGNMAINGLEADPFEKIVSLLEGKGLTKKHLELELELAVANSSAISYLHVGRPETILIDRSERVAKQMDAHKDNGAK